MMSLQTTNAIDTTIDSCRSTDDTPVDKKDCVFAALHSVIGVAMSALQYHNTGSLTGSDVAKRGTSGADEFFQNLPEELKITDVKHHGERLHANASSLAVRRRDLHEGDGHIRNEVQYNGTLPLTFIYHHDHHNDSRPTIPIFMATDGSRLHMAHLQPVDTSAAGTHMAANGTSGTTKRQAVIYPLNGYRMSHVGPGLKVQSNSRSIAAFYDVVNWMDTMDPITGITLAEDLYEKGGYTSWLGHALKGAVFDPAGNPWYGQFIIEAEAYGFGSNWETGWNWCFGGNPTNCFSLDKSRARARRST